MLAASCMRKPAVGMKVKTASERATKAQKMVMELLVADQPARATSHDPTSKFWGWAERTGVTESRFPAAERWSTDAEPPGHARQPRRLHPVRALRARLPRGAGQRRDRHGLPQRRRQGGVRLRRPDGRVDLRRLRRMRAGLPDRRADARRLSRRARRPARSGRTARWIRSAPIAASAARSPTTSRTRRSSMPRAATGRPTRSGSASRAASASTTSTIRTG